MNTRYMFGLALIELIIEGEPVELVIDTGFSGEILLPAKLIKRLGLEKAGVIRYILADGSVAQSGTFSAQVMWGKTPLDITVVAGEDDFALVGMELLHHAKTYLEPSKNVIRVETYS